MIADFSTALPLEVLYDPKKFNYQDCTTCNYRHMVWEVAVERGKRTKTPFLSLLSMPLSAQLKKKVTISLHCPPTAAT